jgi:predicted protein tyrosine phosphatase
MNVLFVCNQNKNRSKTAKKLFRDQFETQSAGLYNERPVTAKQLSWADVVVVMEEAQRSELGKRFPKEYMQKRIVSLNVPDVYKEGQTALKEVLVKKVKGLL